MVRRRKRRESQADMDDNAGKSVIFISSDDDEANEDLSLEIVSKSRLRELMRKKVENKEKAWEFFEDLSSSPTGKITVVLNGKVDVASEVIDVETEEEEKKKRKRRRKKKKRVVVEEELVTEKLDAPDLEVGPDDPAIKVEPTPIVDSAIEVAIEPSNNIVLRKLLRGPRYFDSGSGSWESCYNCGEEGHVAANCTEEKRKKPCFVCGMFGHNAKYCMQGQECFICKRKGHYAKDCPNKHENISEALTLCLRCGDIGHDMASCINNYAADDIKEIQCYICKKYGHLCCVDYVDNSPSQISCYNCAGTGHSGEGCAKQWGENNASTPATLCYRCGQEGHFARGCTNGPKSVSRYGESSAPVGRLKDNRKDRKDKNDRKDKQGYTGSKSVFKHHGESSRCASRSKNKKLTKSVPKNFGRKHEKESPIVNGRMRPVKSKVRGGWIVDDMTADDTTAHSNRKHIRKEWPSPVTPSARGSQNYYATSIHRSYSRSYNVHNTLSGGNYSSPYTPHQRYHYNAGAPNSRSFTRGYHHGYSASRYDNSYDYYS